MKFSVSVVIPAFNAEKFIEKSINSALIQPEVAEVILIDDGSTDKTLKLAQIIQTTNSKIKIFQHNNNINRGRSASRNLGIKKATCTYLAFLDADDFYLADRFKKDRELLSKSNKIDGVYNAISANFYRETNTIEKNNLEITTITKKIEPEHLFDALMSGKDGYFSIDGLTVKQSVFKRIGYFNEGLSVSEDTELFYRLSLKCKLVGGIIDKPLAMRGVHDSNVFNRTDLYEEYEFKMYESLYFWSIKKNMGLKTIERFLERIWILRFKQKNGLFMDMIYWFTLVINNPSIIFSNLTIKYFPVVRLRKKLFPFIYDN